MSCDRAQCLTVARTCAVLNLRRAARAVTSRYEGEMRGLGLKATQFSLLVATALRGPVPVTHLAHLMVMDRTTLTRNLKPMERKGWLSVHPGTDRRTRNVTLTAAGEDLLEQALPLWRRAQQRMIEGLGDERFSTLLEGLGESVEVARD